MNKYIYFVTVTNKSLKKCAITIIYQDFKCVVKAFLFEIQ